ncbi:unnamed protein product [Brassicogethes aeneus]|uniref:Uncharacterized protein n=1 Tax=Brassicogethes aeneus TaxID=1431903 RepID=A0A9P0AU96_BRAAE|nr:unnamed protein product [Brassicogethes aeneus]
MEQIVIKKEPEELVDDSKGDISMNYDELSTAADQKTILTSGIAIKQEIKEELDDFKALLEIGSEFNSDDERGDLCSNVKEEEMDCEFFEEVDTEFFNNEDNEEKVEDKAMSEIKIEVEYHGVQSDKSGIMFNTIKAAEVKERLKKMKEESLERNKKQQEEKYERKKRLQREKYWRKKTEGALQCPEEGKPKIRQPGGKTESTTSKTEVKKTRNNIDRKRALNRERQRRYIEKIKSNEELEQIYKDQQKEKYKKRKAAGKIISIEKLTPRQKKYQREKWKEVKQKYRQQKRHLNQVIENTPPSTPPNSRPTTPILQIAPE